MTIKKIIYPNDDLTIAIVTPSPDCELSVEEIARKDVPLGKPYYIIDNELLPSTYQFWAAWEADFSNPDGYGIGHKAWFAEQVEKGIA